MTVKNRMPPSTQKFSLNLISKSNKKRIAEASEKLKSLYPFEVETNKLYICPTSNKGVYDVYVSDTVVEKKSQIGKVFILATLIILICLIVFAGWKRAESRKNEVIIKKQMEVEAAEQEKAHRQKENQLVQLQQEYSL